MTDPISLLKTATAAAKAAGDFLTQEHKKYFVQKSEELQTFTKSSSIDLVTEVDRKAQEIVISMIQDRFPDHRFIAEEEGADTLGSPDSPYEWIIDPLDGTTNFIHGKYNFGTIIAVQMAAEVILSTDEGRLPRRLQAGCMWMPLQDCLYQAARGNGATVNGETIKLRTTKNLSDAVLSCNVIHRAIPASEIGTEKAASRQSFPKDSNEDLYISVPRCGSLENYGCAADELGAIAQGWNDGVFWRGIRLWDIAAGCLIIEEAGGKYRYEFMTEGDVRSGLLCVVSTEPIFDELCEFVFERKLA